MTYRDLNPTPFSRLWLAIRSGDATADFLVCTTVFLLSVEGFLLAVICGPTPQ